MRKVFVIVFGGKRIRGTYNPDTEMLHGPRCVTYHRSDIEEVLEGSLD